MQIAIFIFYLLFFSFLISIIYFFKTSGIGKWTLIVLFLIKISAGIVYAKFYTLPKYYEGSDTWRFYRLSLVETKDLLHHPLAFVKDLFTYGYNTPGNIFSGQNTYWNDLKSNLIVKLLAIINVFTNSSYYSNIIFFNFLFLFGLVALFKLFYQIFPDKKLQIIAGIFLLPSTLFWCSGIHKDGLILSATGTIIYTFYSCMNKRFSFTKISILCFALLVVFALRNYVLFALFPALLSWWLCKKYPGKNLKIFIAVYLLMATSALIISSMIPSLNFLSFIVNKQHEFLLLQGGSKVDIPQLKQTFISFILFLPDALDMAFLRPHADEIRNISYIPAFVENIFLLLLLLISPLYIYKKQQAQPVILVLFIFSVSILLIAGYTIPFTGAIVRYKSLVLPLLITPLLCINDFFVINKIRSRFNSSKFFFRKSY